MLKSAIAMLLFSVCNIFTANGAVHKTSDTTNPRRWHLGLLANYNYDWKAFGYPYWQIPKLYARYNFRNKWSLSGHFIFWEEGRKNPSDPTFQVGKIDLRNIINLFGGYGVIQKPKLRVDVGGGLRLIHGTLNAYLVQDGKWIEMLAHIVTQVRPGTMVEINYLPLRFKKWGLGILLNQQIYYKSDATTSGGLFAQF